MRKSIPPKNLKNKRNSNLLLKKPYYTIVTLDFVQVSVYFENHEDANLGL